MEKVSLEDFLNMNKIHKEIERKEKNESLSETGNTL